MGACQSSQVDERSSASTVGRMIMKIPSERTKNTFLLKRNSSSILYESFRYDNKGSIEDFYSGVYDGKILESKKTGIVRLCTHKITGDEFAIRIMDLEKAVQGKLLHLKSEINWMTEICHSNILRLEEVYQSPSEVFLVHEIYKEGISYEELNIDDKTRFSEAEVIDIVKKMIEALNNIYSRGMKHFNVSLASYMFSVKNRTDLKLVDFGHEKYFPDETPHGSPSELLYARDPEMLCEIYDERCDLWSIGIIAYILFTGEAPYGGYNGKPFIPPTKSSKSPKYPYGMKKFSSNLSKLGKEFINKLLQRNPIERFQTMTNALTHPWFTNFDSSSKNISNEENVIENQGNSKDENDIEKFCCKMLSHKLTSDQVHDLRIFFEHFFMDEDKYGFIDLDALKNALIVKKECAALGAVTDFEINAIFNELGVQRTQINWYKFLDTLMKMCESDEESIREAFHRIDKNKIGTIALYDLTHFQANVTSQQKGELKNMFEEGVKIRKERNKVTRRERYLQYDDFLFLMKGQSTHSSNTSWNGAYYLKMRNLLLDKSTASNKDHKIDSLGMIQPNLVQHSDIESLSQFYEPSDRSRIVRRSFSDTGTKELKTYPSKFELRSFYDRIHKKHESAVLLHGIAA